MSAAPESRNDRSAPDSEWAAVSFPQVYDCLRDIAAQWLEKERPDHTLQPTALVHEAYLRLAHRPTPADRRQFYAFAARAMRRVLVDYARRKGARKRRPPPEAFEDPGTAVLRLDALLDLEVGLERLSVEFPRACRVVELRFFAGMTVQEAAEVLDVSSRTVDLDWRFARAWLLRALNPEAVG